MAETQTFFIQNETLRLNHHGVWLANGQEITHEGTCRMFFRHLKHDAEGYLIQVGKESKRVEVEDTPFFISRVDGNPDEGYRLWIRGFEDEPQEILDAGTLRYRPGRLTCTLKKGTAHEGEAKFLQAAYFDVLKHLNEDDFVYFLEVQGAKIVLGRKQI